MKNLKLAEHVLAMANDVYLTGHPEWAEMVSDARSVVLEQIKAHQAIQRVNPPSSKAWEAASFEINRLAPLMATSAPLVQP